MKNRLTSLLALMLGLGAMVPTPEMRAVELKTSQNAGARIPRPNLPKTPRRRKRCPLCGVGGHARTSRHR